MLLPGMIFAGCFGGFASPCSFQAVSCCRAWSEMVAFGSLKAAGWAWGCCHTHPSFWGRSVIHSKHRKVWGDGCLCGTSGDNEGKTWKCPPSLFMMWHTLLVGICFFIWVHWTAPWTMACVFLSQTEFSELSTIAWESPQQHTSPHWHLTQGGLCLLFCSQ